MTEQRRYRGQVICTALQSRAVNIVNQLFDLAEVPVEKRQEINDEADAFVYRLLTSHTGRDVQ